MASSEVSDTRDGLKSKWLETICFQPWCKEASIQVIELVKVTETEEKSVVLTSNAAVPPYQP